MKKKIFIINIKVEFHNIIVFESRKWFISLNIQIRDVSYAMSYFGEGWLDRSISCRFQNTIVKLLRKMSMPGIHKNDNIGEFRKFALYFVDGKILSDFAFSILRPNVSDRIHIIKKNFHVLDREAAVQIISSYSSRMKI